MRAPVREPARAPAPQARPAVATPAPQPTPMPRPQVRTARDFTDLLQANARYANAFPNRGFNGLAQAGVAVVTCMDSRIDPLGMLGLKPGDAKIIRNPGGRVSPDAIEGLILATSMLGVRRILVIAHTECAMSAQTDKELRQSVTRATGQDAGWQPFHVFRDPAARLRDDVRVLRSHPLIRPDITIGGFLYDVATGQLHQEA